MILFFALVAAFVLAADPAHADPITAAVAWVGTTLGVGAATAAAIVNMGLGLASSLLSSVLAKTQAQKPKVNVQFDVQMGDDTPLTFIVGDYVTGGKRKYINSWGKNNRYITEVIEVSALPHPTLAGMWVNDELGEILFGETDTDGTEHTLGHPLTNYADEDLPGKHFIWVKWVNATQTAADPLLRALFGDDEDYPWTAAMIGTGKSYAIVTTRYNKDTLSTYPAYLFQPSPLPVYDLRFDTTAGGSGPQRWNNRSTWQPSRNPAVIAYNVIRGVYYGDEWVFGGKNLAAWRLPAAEWIAAANECDATIELLNGGTEPTFRCGMEIRVDMDAADVLEEIGRASNMRFPLVGGQIKALVGLPGAAVFSFSDADVIITEGQSFKPFFPLSETFNALSATYPEPAEKWSTKDSPEYIDTEAMAADDGRYLPTSISYPAAPYRRQVQRLQRFQMRDYRRMRTHQFSLPPDAFALEPGDMVSWNSGRNGYVNKKFIMESVVKLPGMNTTISMREVDPNDNDWSSDFERPTTVLPPIPVRPFTQPIAGFAVDPYEVQDENGAARRPALLVRCNGDEVGVNSIRLQVRVQGTTQNIVDQRYPFAAPFQWVVLGLLPATTYQVRGQLLSELTPRSAWSAWVSETTPDTRLGRPDIVQDILDDLDDALAWIDGIDEWVAGVIGPLQAESERIDARVTALAQTVTDQTAAIRLELQQGLASANGYTDTAIEDYSVVVNGQVAALVGQIEQLTAALTSENLITNGEFTTDAANWTLTNAGRFASVGSTDALVAAAPAPGVVAIGAGVMGNIVHSLSSFTVTSDDRLQLRFGAATVATTRNLSISFAWLDGAGSAIGSPTTVAVTVSPANQWKVYSVQVDPPDDAVGCTMTVNKTQSGIRVLVTKFEATTVNVALEARIATLEAARVTDQASLATYQQTVAALFDDADAALAVERTARANADGALGLRIDTVEAVNATQQASITEQATAIADAEESISQVKQELAASFGNTQLVRDPKFDSELAFWTGNLSTIARLTARNTASADLWLKGMPAPKAFRIDAGDGTGLQRQSNTFDVVPADRLTLGFHYWRGSASVPQPLILLQFLNASGGQTALIQLPGTGNSAAAWLYAAVADIEPPANTTQGRVLMRRANVAATAGTVAYVTNITVNRQLGYEAWTSAQLTEVRQAQSNADSAFTAYRESMSAILGNIDTGVGSVATQLTARYTKAETHEVMSTAISNMTATLRDEIGQRATASSVQALVNRVTNTETGLAAVSVALTDVNAQIGTATANGRLVISSEATAAGVKARVGFRARTVVGGIGGAVSDAAMFLESLAGDTSRVSIIADRFAIVSGSAADPTARMVPFYIADGRVYIETAFIRDLTVDTLKLADGAVTATFSATGAGGAPAVWTTALNLNVPMNYPGDIVIGAAATANSSKEKNVSLRLLNNGVVIPGSLYNFNPNEAEAPGSAVRTGRYTAVSAIKVGAGTRQISLQAVVAGAAGAGAGSVSDLIIYAHRTYK